MRLSNKIIIGLALSWWMGWVGVEGADRVGGTAGALAGLREWLGKERGARGDIGAMEFARVGLTKEGAEEAKMLLWNDYAGMIRETRKAEMEGKAIRIGDHEMKFEIVRFGEKAMIHEGGRSLFISMHGGGGAPVEVNDGQWRNQIQLGQAYRPSEGLYVAPRAPSNSWKLWHEAAVDGLFDRLIADLIVLEGVNPNRVYLMGYSAGGDGVYQLGPRMADRWAAAAMMAGHPNSASPVNLRNLPFVIQVGGNDGAYRRNKVGAEWGKKLDALEVEDGKGGYRHLTKIHEGKGHWMDLEDRLAIPWMEKCRRDPRPERIVWRQEGVMHSSFYWLAVPLAGARVGQEIRAERSGQNLVMTVSEVKEFSVRLSDAMLDMDRPVSIRVGDKVVFEGLAVRTMGTLARTLIERGDPEYIFSAEIEISLGEKAGEAAPSPR